MDRRSSVVKGTPRPSVIEEEGTAGVVNVASVTVSDPSESHSTSLRSIRVSRRLELAEKKEEKDDPDISDCIVRWYRFAFKRVWEVVMVQRSVREGISGYVQFYHEIRRSTVAYQNF